mmetsp:Transcript_39423/g.84007  ORF Transcript_39423/g.84007 Transcript_39423/m.84007 type:complete len:220 (+) Transcript_39423:679-1338(+)
MVLHPVDELEHEVDLAVLEGGDHLERAEELACREAKGGFAREDLVNRYVHRGRLPRAVALGNAVVGERLATEGELGARHLEAGTHVAGDVGVAPGEHGRAGEVLEGAQGGSLSELLYDAEVHPLLVRDEHRLRRALLPREGVRVLVALPDHELHLRRVRPEDLPVEARVLELDPPLELDRQLVSNRLRASEEAHPTVALHHELVHHGPVGVDVVHVGGR